MNDLTLLDELDEVSLSDQTGLAVYPAPTEGRVAHIDADFLAYQVSAETKAELDENDPTPRRTLDEMKYNAERAAQHLMRLAGATSYVLHVTPSGSTKGGRHGQAVQKMYQGTRSSKEKPEYLDTIREYLAKDLGGIAHTEQEADDGLAQALYAAKDPNLAVVMSKDKDLRMVTGLHCCPDTGEFQMVEKGDFGFIQLDRTKSSPKVVGYGPKFFWAQLLMGDTADNVSGVPCVSGEFWQKYQPTEVYLKAVRDLETLGYTQQYVGETKVVQNTRTRCLKIIEVEHGKTKKIGAVAAFDLLNPITSNKEAFALVKEAFMSAVAVGHEYKHWETLEPVTPTQALLGDMFLTWMRRTANPKDVLVWLKEEGCL